MKLHHNPLLLLLIAAFLMNCHIVVNTDTEHYAISYRVPKSELTEGIGITYNRGEFMIVKPQKHINL